MLNKSFVQELTLFFQNPAFHNNTGIAQHGQTAPGHYRVRVPHCGKDPGNSRFDQSLGTGGRPAVVGTGFQGYINIGALSSVSSLAKSMYFSMGRARFPMPSFTDYLPVPDNNTPNGWVWRRPAKSAASKCKCSPHYFAIKIGHVQNVVSYGRG
jgi:hypothetical protein